MGHPPHLRLQVTRRGDRVPDLQGERSEALKGHGLKKLLAVGEVPSRRRMGDTEIPGELTP